jgi:hypothetical protein
MWRYASTCAGILSVKCKAYYQYIIIKRDLYFALSLQFESNFCSMMSGQVNAKNSKLTIFSTCIDELIVYLGGLIKYI